MNDFLDLAAKVLAVLGSFVSLVLGVVRLIRTLRERSVQYPAAPVPRTSSRSTSWLRWGIVAGLLVAAIGVMMLLIDRRYPLDDAYRRLRRHGVEMIRREVFVEILPVVRWPVARMVEGRVVVPPVQVDRLATVRELKRGPI